MFLSLVCVSASIGSLHVDFYLLLLFAESRVEFIRESLKHRKIRLGRILFILISDSLVGTVLLKYLTINCHRDFLLLLALNWPLLKIGFGRRCSCGSFIIAIYSFSIALISLFSMLSERFLYFFHG